MIIYNEKMEEVGTSRWVEIDNENIMVDEYENKKRYYKKYEEVSDIDKNSLSSYGFIFYIEYVNKVQKYFIAGYDSKNIIFKDIKPCFGCIFDLETKVLCGKIYDIHDDSNLRYCFERDGEKYYYANEI